MRVGFESENRLDENGNPTGGFVRGVGFEVRWQSGPLGRPVDEATRKAVEECPEPGWHETHRYCPVCPWTEDLGRQAPNGAFVEDVIAASIQRLEFFQGHKFSCEENDEAIEHLYKALAALDRRTKRREAEGIEGTHREDPS